jgi:dihydroorotate dehydrogenase
VNLNKLSLKLTSFLAPEMSSNLSLTSLKALYNSNLLKSFFATNQKVNEPFKLLNLSFPNRIGVAAGMDKNADYFHVLEALGFGFVEVGTITLKPQMGNPKPRIHKFSKDRSIVNSLGFNNVGVVKALKNIEKNKRNFKGVLGVSIGKGKDIKNERAHEDYLHLMDYLYDVSDYLAINISSPNTKDLRKLTANDFFKNLIDKIINKSEQLSGGASDKKSIFLKLSPNESKENLENIISYSAANGIDGFILTNTSVNHNYELAGGMSGAPLKQDAEECLKFSRSILGPNIPIIASGGIMSKEDAEQRFDLSADLIQLYSGFVFQGNDLLQDCLKI